MEEAIDNHNNMNTSPDKYQIWLKYKKIYKTFKYWNDNNDDH